MEQTFTPTPAERNRQRVLNQEAAAWLLTLEEDHSPETAADFRRWLERSADHIQTFLEVTAIESELDGMGPELRIDLAALIAEVREDGPPNIATLAPSTASRAPAPPTVRWRSRPRIAAGLAGLGVLVGLFVWTASVDRTSYATALGEQRAVKLDDGSLAHLNTLTRIEVDFTEHARDVRLVEGEALFSVEHDAKRPFRVIAGSAVVQAVGTQFNVYRHAAATTVSVVEGTVKISAQAADPLMLKAGEAADVKIDGQVAKQSQGHIARAISWRQRQLSFDHDPLGEVAEQFNRYNRLQILIADPEVRARELEGIFNADEPQALLDFLALDRDLRFERTENSVSIHLRSQ